jgi:hypothetical protein
MGGKPLYPATRETKSWYARARVCVYVCVVHTYVYIYTLYHTHAHTCTYTQVAEQLSKCAVGDVKMKTGYLQYTESHAAATGGAREFPVTANYNDRGARTWFSWLRVAFAQDTDMLTLPTESHFTQAKLKCPPLSTANEQKVLAHVLTHAQMQMQAFGETLTECHARFAALQATMVQCAAAGDEQGEIESVLKMDAIALR